MGPMSPGSARSSPRVHKSSFENAKSHYVLVPVEILSET